MTGEVCSVTPDSKNIYRVKKVVSEMPGKQTYLDNIKENWQEIQIPNLLNNFVLKFKDRR
jgi:hypothetical protein